MFRRGGAVLDVEEDQLDNKMPLEELLQCQIKSTDLFKTREVRRFISHSMHSQLMVKMILRIICNCLFVA